ncbi:copper resistance protein NlpE N-terminal domain-containing protein [Kushneria phyllosphaerae]|uniref:Copper homeostasis protein CutF n=1 Tax=Kushneria phyllosphaerae TaxID=2100822 RepID=A0A2R8CL26_9GAMM|nr:copper resistance protein NlpE N-terminal domain-containing protein [Kushneria phyllosphaerae]SPJ33579.1 hypothetical protein KSP9073_01588 [Kushneria phyllosphaerae]
MKALILISTMMTVLLWVTGCASTPSSQVHAIKVAERFEGTLPCPDCHGVVTDLVIRRDPVTGAPDNFYLHEVRIDAPGGQRVNTIWGRWRLEHDLFDEENQRYRLAPEIGAPRLMLIRADGTLQPADNEGRGVTNDEGEPALLKPMTPDLSIAAMPSS